MLVGLGHILIRPCVCQLLNLPGREAFKDGVYAKAKAHGLWPKWRPNEGWRLTDGGGQTVIVGPMETLEMCLVGLG